MGAYFEAFWRHCRRILYPALIALAALSGQAYGTPLQTEIISPEMADPKRAVRRWSDSLSPKHPDDLSAYLRATENFSLPLVAEDFLEVPLLEKEMYFTGLIDGFRYFLEHHGIDRGFSHCSTDISSSASISEGKFKFFLTKPEAWSGLHETRDLPTSYTTDLFAEFVLVNCLVHERLF